jgi:FkbM family methyltransferase
LELFTADVSTGNTGSAALMSPWQASGIRRTLRKTGFDVVRYPREPPEGSLELAFRTLLRDSQPDVVIDIGANAGQFGQAVRALGFDGRIVSFEPVSATFAKLRAAAVVDDRWETHRLALGSTPGQLPIHVPKFDRLASLLPANDQGRKTYRHRLEEMEHETVEVVRLDAIWDTVVRGNRALIKIDTQGFDFHVLQGSIGVLDRVIGIQTELLLDVYYEGATGYLATLEWLRRQGFEPLAFRPESYGEGNRLAEVDCLLGRMPALIRHQ